MITLLPAAAGYDAAAAALAAAGLRPDDVVHVTEYRTAAGDPAAVDRARERLLDGHAAPVSTVPVHALPGGGAYAVALAAEPGGGSPVTVDGAVLRVADGVVHLPSVYTTEGAFRDQYQHCLERLGELLGGAGLGLDALVLTTDYTATATRAEYPRCGRPRRELLGPGPVHPGAAGILVDTPVAPGAAVVLDALAVTGPRRAVNPGWRRYDTLTYQPGVAAGRHLFMSGFGALDPATQAAVHAGDLAAQAAYVYDAVDRVLAAAGATGADVVSLVEYLTPGAVAGYPRIAALRAERFPRAAVTSVVCSALLRPEFLIEVVPRAVLP